MRLKLSAPSDYRINAEIQITGSKSESNRLLLLQALFPNIQVENLSNSDDTGYMARGLSMRSGTVDIHHAGTAMRFLTAYFSTLEGTSVILTGSERMQERPIEILVDALRKLGADIEYLRKKGYPPIRIEGKQLQNSVVSLPANVSSQYISALILIAPRLENGLELTLEGRITSVPYINMTLALLSQLGIPSSFKGNIIKVQSVKAVDELVMTVESDWSSASYFFSIMALAPVGSQLKLGSYKKESLQGDSVLTDIYRDFGIQTQFDGYTLVLKRREAPDQEVFEYDLADAPDLAQTIAVTCFGLGKACNLTGLHTLKIKETDRLEALKTELTKLGAHISVTDKSLHLQAAVSMRSGVSVDTYNDHRMAMAFAPLALKTKLFINEAEVVSKSYPDYWKDLKALDFQIDQI